MNCTKLDFEKNYQKMAKRNTEPATGKNQKKRKTKYTKHKTSSSLPSTSMMTSTTSHNNLNSSKSFEEVLNNKAAVKQSSKQNGNKNTANITIELLKTLRSQKNSINKQQQEIDQLKRLLKQQQELTSSAFKKKKFRKSRKLTNQFDKVCKEIGKTKIFRKVKYIMHDDELKDYTSPNSIGRYFLNQYASVDKGRFRDSLLGNEEEYWEAAKFYVCQAITEKRSSRIAQFKKAWISK